MTDTTRMHKVEIDAENPLEAGAQVADQLAMPIMKGLEDGMDHLARVHLWTGFFSATLGMMTAAVGPDDAEVIYHALRGAFDEARQIRVMPEAKGVH